jgi:hypothetical protein
MQMKELHMQQVQSQKVTVQRYHFVETDHVEKEINSA